MTRQEIAGVVGILAVAFGRDASVETFEVYEAALADLDVEDPLGLVRRLLRTMERWPPPAVLRKAILAQYGLLAADHDQAWSVALEWSTSPHGLGVRPPEVVMEAIEAVGGSWAVRHTDRSIIHAQFRDAYRLAKERHDHEVLERTWAGLALLPGDDDGRREALGTG